MAVPRTADFVAAGRTDAQASRARGSLVATRYPRDSKSWQAKAYWSGFDEEVERLSKSAVLNKENFTRAVEELVASGVKIVATRGPLYPPKLKARSRRPGGWTGAA